MPSSRAHLLQSTENQINNVFRKKNLPKEFIFGKVYAINITVNVIVQVLFGAFSNF